MPLYSTASLSLKANLASPTFTGTPLAPTAAPGANSTQIATAAFVQGELVGSELDSSAVQITHTGTLTETILKTISIPAGSMGPNGRIEIVTLWSYTNSANNKILRARLGGIGGTAFMNTTHTTTLTAQLFNIIRNRNSQSSQVAFGAGIVTGPGNSNTAVLTTGIIDTSAAQDLVLTATLANTGESINLEAYQVTVYYKV